MNSTSRYKMVIFDFDGTLADSFPWFVGVINDVASKFNFRRVESHEIEGLRGYDARRLMKHLGIPFWKVPLIARHMQRMMTRDIERIALFEGVEPLLRELRQRGITLALVTSNTRENALRALGPENAALFDHFVCGASILGKHAKFKKLLKTCGLLPQETLCIGDELRDIEAARKEAIPFGAVAWGYTSEDALRAAAPLEVFKHADEILTAVS